LDRKVILVLGVVVVATALLMIGQPAAPPQGPANANAAAKPANQDTSSGTTANTALAPQAADPARGSVAPDFTLTALDGSEVRLSSFKGKAVMVNFWATWCEPCKIEMPWLVDLQKQFGPQGLQILGVALDDADTKTIAQFTHKMGVNYPVLKGTDKVADLYGGADRLPISFFVDRSGKVVDETVGLVSESVIVDAIKRSLAQGAQTGPDNTEAK
jgi:thiol-disulfide isomerase/thioredoxin